MSVELRDLIASICCQSIRLKNQEVNKRNLLIKVSKKNEYNGTHETKLNNLIDVAIKQANLQADLKCIGSVYAA